MKLCWFGCGILAVLLALSLTSDAVALQKSRGFVITERMSQAEKDQLVEESSIVYARKQIDADGTVHYFNSDGSEALVLSAEEDAAYQTRLRAEHDRAVCESTALVDLSTMPVLPNAVTELAVDADGNFAGFGFENAQMVLLYPEASGGFSLQAGDTVTLTVYRNGEYIPLDLTFDEQPQTTGTEDDSSNQNQGQQDSYGDLYDYFFGRGNGGRGN